MSKHAMIETGFYDNAGEWRRINGPTVFGSERSPFGGWGSWDALCAGLQAKHDDAMLAFGVLEFGARCSPCPELKQRFTLVDPQGFAAARGNRTENAR